MGCRGETGWAAGARRVSAVLALSLACCGCSAGRLIESARLGIETAAGPGLDPGHDAGDRGAGATRKRPIPLAPWPRHLLPEGRRNPQAVRRFGMKALLLIGTSLLALTAPVAHAQMQTSPAGGSIAEPGQTSPGDYLVFFAFDSAELEADARQTIAEAAEAYRRTGEAQQITATGHTDTSGSAEYNLELSQRRAEAVAAELVRQGVPATDIVTVGRGEEDLLVPTADGVREPRNRRVEIVVPQPPPAPEPAPVVAAPPPPPEPEPEPDRFTFALGPVYGHNFGETDGEEAATRPRTTWSAPSWSSGPCRASSAASR